MWILKVPVLIGGRHLFEAWRLLEEIRYLHSAFDCILLLLSRMRFRVNPHSIVT